MPSWFANSLQISCTNYGSRDHNLTFMVHLKIILDTRRKKSDGTYPVVYRITDVKKVLIIQSGISVAEDLWNSEERFVSNIHPNFQTLNASLSKKYYDIQKAIVNLEDDNCFSFESLKEALENKPKQASRNITFYNFSFQMINHMLEEQRIGNAIVYRTAVNRLINKEGRTKIALLEVI
jgi:hypothetical protein